MYIEPFWIGFIMGIIVAVATLAIWGSVLNRKERKKNDKGE